MENSGFFGKLELDNRFMFWYNIGIKERTPPMDDFDCCDFCETYEDDYRTFEDNCAYEDAMADMVSDCDCGDCDDCEDFDFGDDE